MSTLANLQLRLVIDLADPIDLAAETTKQILTLSTAIITVGFAYVKDIAPNYEGRRVFLVASVVFQLLSCGFGIWTMMAITGVSNDPARVPDGVFSFSVTLPAMAQIVLFFLGLCSMCLVILGIRGAQRRRS